MTDVTRPRFPRTARGRNAALVPLALACLLAVLRPAAAADGTWRFAVGGGPAAGPEIVAGRVTVGTALFQLPLAWAPAPWVVRWEAGLGLYERATGDLDGKRVYSVALRAVVEVPFAEGSPWFAELGTGVMRLSDTTVLDGFDFGEKTEFDSHVGLGYHFGEGRRWDLVYGFHHASNASLGTVNPGLNYHLVEVAYRY